MADDSEEKSSVSQDFSNTKDAIFQTFNKLKKWREEQFEQFRNLQYLESQKLIRLSGESQKQFEKLLGNASKSIDADERPKNNFPENSYLSLKNDLENYDTLHESSLTGHLQRCFDDSATNSFSTSENKDKGNCGAQQTTVFKDVQNCQKLEQNVNIKEDQLVKNVSDSSLSTKPKRSFLRKGTGLLRYMPKSSPNGQQRKKKGSYVHNTPVKSTCLPQKTLQLKPAIRKIDIPSENVKHIRFDIPVEGNDESFAENYTPLASELFENKIDDDAKDKYSSLSSISPDHIPQRNSKLDISNSETGSLNLAKENKELEEFEMLENCVQNSSFNSDSSVVQRILHGDKVSSNIVKPVPVIQKEILKPTLSRNVNTVFKETFKSPSENSIFSAKVGLSKCLEEAHARKELLQKVISDINPRIQSLQREIYRSQHEAVDDSDISERCSTPVENLNVGDRITPSLAEDCSDVVFSDIQVSHPKSSARFGDDNDICQTHCKSCDDGVEDLLPYDDNLAEEASFSEESDAEVQNQQVLDDRSKIRNKLKELQEEIEIYQGLNAELSSKCKEKNEFLKKFQKEREEFNKYKEAEKKKLEAEIDEERRQIKRQKETFNRYQKLRKDNPTRKERDELNALRQEIEKLQEDLKRQKIKYTSDSRRWKNQLEIAERERDSFKLENIRLEEQIQDLLTAFKSRNEWKKKTDSKISDKTDNGTGHENLTKVLPTTKDAECQTETKCFTSDQSKVSKQVSPKNSVKKTKAKVRFNLSHEHQVNELENVCENVEDTQENLFKDDFQHTENTVTVIDNEDENVEKNSEVNLSTISVSADCEVKEIDHGNKRGLVAVITIDDVHNHSLYTAETLKFLPTTDSKEKFFNYFNDGMGAAESSKYHESLLQLKEEFKEEDMANSRINPPYRTVHYWYDQWRLQNLGPRTGQGVIEMERIHDSGDREIIFRNGTRKIISADGKVKFLFHNGDVKEIFPDKHEVYRYVNGITETHFPDGLEVTEFPNGQVQKRYPGGQKEVTFPDGTVHNTFADGSEEIRTGDGNVVIHGADGTKTIEFANGQREIITATYKRREFPDGAVKIVYDSGRQEKRYPNGRIIIKDKDKKVIFDTKYLGLTKD